MEMEGGSASIRSSRTGVHATAVRRTIRHMETRLDRKVDLDELAAVACMSPCHYLRVFRGLTGIPPARFLGILRLQLAKELLIKTERPVLDIALDVGYASLGTFTSRFAQLVGMSPARFRETYLAIGRRGAAAIHSPPSRAAETASGARFHGRIDHAERNVILFVGLFNSPIPQDVPLSCMMLADGAHFSLSVPDGPGPFHLLGVALKRTSAEGMFDNRGLIAGVCACGPLRATDVSIPLELRLRALDLLDPPILVAFPMLMHMRMTGDSGAAVEDGAIESRASNTAIAEVVP